MPRYAIESYTLQHPHVVIKVVFFEYNYQPVWMTTPKGKPTIPQKTLHQLILQRLNERVPLDDNLFNDYVVIAEQQLVEQLISKGKAEGAHERAHLRMAEILNAMQAIIVADDLNGQLSVQCLNKGQTVAVYDAKTKSVAIDEFRWNVAADFEAPSAPTQNGRSDSPRRENPIREGDGGTSKESSRNGKKHVGAGRDVTPKKRFKWWWRKNSFVIFATIFFIILSTAIVLGLLHLQKSIEALPDKTDAPQPAIQHPMHVDSLQQKADSLVLPIDSQRESSRVQSHIN